MISQEQARQIMVDRQRAYLRVFKMTEAAGEAVLADLAQFCRANEACVVAPAPTAPIDVYRTFVNEGRREVYLRIMDQITLSEQQLFERYTIPVGTRE